MTQAFYGKTQKIHHAQFFWGFSSVWLEREFCTLEVVGSSPITSTNSVSYGLSWRIKEYRLVAQLVELRTYTGRT